MVGTRAEAVKTAPFIRALHTNPHTHPLAISTGQHHDAAVECLKAFGITPDVALVPPAPHEPEPLASRLAAFTAALAPVLTRAAVDTVVVQGDTLSALAGALTAFLGRVPVVHLEAGLRTGDLSAPFPEEANRALIADIAALHLAPTAAAARNLRAEGIPGDRILVIGNTAVDAVLRTASAPRPAFAPTLETFLTRPGPLLLASAHRRESWGAPLDRIITAIGGIARRHPEANVLVCAHPNPALHRRWAAGLPTLANLHLTGPLPYAGMAHLLPRAALVITDSGGLQEEAPAFATPVLVIRETTERVEGLRAGCAHLVGTHTHRIVEEATRLLTTPRPAVPPGNPYGDGRAAERAAAACAALLGHGPMPAPWHPAGGREGRSRSVPVSRSDLAQDPVPRGRRVGGGEELHGGGQPFVEGEEDLLRLGGGHPDGVVQVRELAHVHDPVAVAVGEREVGLDGRADHGGDP
ncbi:non-hydrolyzing UDP-N-acetylglucosamine 2-epimerase [Streptomyces sp. NPDC048337]|uniref:non-hydrolyzing UDP-N-acetylglucosamine 2-epimerase n=1 Tax=Streptomyces sp. NPDC048337 TaxID=3365535 RepID=UPI0037193683